MRGQAAEFGTNAATLGRLFPFVSLSSRGDLFASLPIYN